MSKERIKNSIFLILFCTKSIVFAQHYITHFGQNRIQYKNLDWYYYSTNHFDVYYYPGSHKYALEAANFLEKEYFSLTNRLGYAPFNKIKIFIYNSVHDLQQSNIGIDGTVFTIGGQTDFVKLDVEIAYPGEASQFKNDLLYELSKAIISDMMYGGSFTQRVQSNYFLLLPEWFIDGVARYLAYGWSREMDDFIRDYISKKRIKKLKRIHGKNASQVGHSIWNFVANEYGEKSIANILNLIRINRKEETSIANTLGLTFKTFLDRWQNYYLLQKEEIDKSHIPMENEFVLKEFKNKKQLISSTISFNKDADKVAYATLKNGTYHIYIYDFNEKNTKKIITGGYRINGQKVDDHLPLLDWQNEYTLGMIIFRRGFLYLYTHNLQTGEKRQKPLSRFRQIENFSFNDNGKLIVISGDIDGRNDLYLTAINRNTFRRITRDAFDDLDPVFIPGTAAIIFSSNRTNDSVKVRKQNIESLQNNFNLFIYDLDTTIHRFHSVTNNHSQNTHPYVKNENEIFYLSDQKGIANLYKYNVRKNTSFQVTNFNTSILSYDLHFDPDKFVYIVEYLNQQRIFLNENSLFLPNKVSQNTPRKQKENLNLLIERNLQSKQKILIPVPVPEKKLEIGTIPALEKNNKKWVDAENFNFEDEKPLTNQTQIESFFSKYRKIEFINERQGPFNYEPRFTFNNAITSFVWDPYREFMVLIETEISDIFENYKIKAGVLTKTNLKQGDIFAEVQYLKYWMDFKSKFIRKTYLIETNNPKTNEPITPQKYQLNKLELISTLPITHTFRVEAMMGYLNTSFTNLNYLSITNRNTNLAANSSENYLTGSISFILDNTIEKEYNLYEGYRGTLSYQTNIHLENRKNNFADIKMDMRYYMRVHKEITLATRLFYGQKLGNSPKNFMIGGMDNWILNQKNYEGMGNPLIFTNGNDNSDIFFNEFVTNLRGLRYNDSHGTRTMVFNAELRIPIFLYLINRPIRSNFVRNFQLISFVDVGSVWEKGRSPWLNLPVIVTHNQGGIFSAELAKHENPWLAGAGIGLRTVLSSYYIKADIAKSYIDNQFSENLKFYLTLGLDF